MTEEKFKKNRPLPDDAYEDLALIVSNADKLGQISESAKEAKAFLNLENYAEMVAEKTGLKTQVAKGIIVSLLRFHQLRSKVKLDIEGFVEWLEEPFVEFAHEQNREDLVEAWPKGLADIREVFDEGSAFGILNKATELVYEHQNVLRDARLLTDLRPVYDKDVKKILRMVVTHQLVLQYSEGSSDKRIYIAVDDSDLKMLERQCKRAREKANLASKSMKENCGWTTYIVGENDE